MCHSNDFLMIILNLFGTIQKEDPFFNTEIFINIVKTIYNINSCPNVSLVDDGKIYEQALHDIFKEIIHKLNIMKVTK